MTNSTYTPRPKSRSVKIIALVGPAQAGKTTVASELQTKYRFIRFRFADTLKNMIEVLGCTREHIDGSLKEQPLDILCGKTTRHAMQTLGTEWRNMLGKELWAVQTATAVAEAAEKAGPGNGPFYVVIDDMRFPHEENALRDAGFDVTVVKVWNSKKRYPYLRMWLARRAWGRYLMRLLPVLYLHESEAWWSVWRTEAEIDNNGSLADLYAQVGYLVHSLNIDDHYHASKVVPRVSFSKAMEGARHGV